MSVVSATYLNVFLKFHYFICQQAMGSKSEQHAVPSAHCSTAYGTMPHTSYDNTSKTSGLGRGGEIFV